MKRRHRPGRGAGGNARQHYLVHPRTLAGGGDLRHITEFLRASGWRDRSVEGGPLAMESPDRMVRLAYDPRGRPGGWAIQGAAAGRQEAWWATLALRTPVEILAGFTDALTHPRPTHAPNVWAPLKQQGWRDQPEAEHPTATSPDDTAWMTYEQGSSGTAWWRCGAKDAQGHGWDGYFTATTPMHLVQALSVALASPQPVMRPHGHVPHSPRIQTQPLSLLPNQLDAWQQDRLAAARTAAQARRTFTRPATAPPAARASRTRTPR